MRARADGVRDKHGDRSINGCYGIIHSCHARDGFDGTLPSVSAKEDVEPSKPKERATTPVLHLLRLRAASWLLGLAQVRQGGARRLASVYEFKTTFSNLAFPSPSQSFFFPSPIFFFFFSFSGWIIWGSTTRTAQVSNRRSARVVPYVLGYSRSIASLLGLNRMRKKREKKRRKKR